MDLQGGGAAFQIPGAAGVEFGADDFTVDFAKFADEKDVGEREEEEGSADKESGVPEVEAKAEAEGFDEGRACALLWVGRCGG
jgi:hypothetical protein